LHKSNNELKKEVKDLKSKVETKDQQLTNSKAKVKEQVNMISSLQGQMKHMVEANSASSNTKRARDEDESLQEQLAESDSFR
jgi:chromosome segregation ATPase